MPSLYSLGLVAALATAVSAQDPTCDVVGFDSGNIFAFLVQEDEALADRLACGATCVADERCGSFAFGEGSCLLYEESIAGNIYEVETSPYTFNDVACVAGEVEAPPAEGEEPPAEGEEPPAEGEPAPEEPPADDQPAEEGQ